MEAALGCERTVSFSANVQCGACAGSGAKPGATMKRCSACNGQGQRVQSNGLFTYAATCGVCEGAGETPSESCGECRGEGVRHEQREVRVKVPAGVDDGVNIRLPHQGEAGRRGGPNGHLFIALSVSDHPVFKRDRFDVYIEAPITISQAVLGGKIRVPTLEGEVDIVIPEGTQPGEKRRLRR